VKVRIDGDRCTGHGRCYAAAPTLFTDDERGYGVVIGDGEVGSADEDGARAAARACPEGAVLVDQAEPKDR
jgi:ferredoxin